MKKWDELSIDARNYINKRFNNYDISGEKAYSDYNLFPDNLKKLDSDEIIEVLKTKDISHVMPISEYPELYSNINNIIFEDFSINRARGAIIIDDTELEIAKIDYASDIKEFEESIDFLEHLPDILIGSTAVGLGVSSYRAYEKIKNGEILLNESPRYILVNSGGKIIRCAIIGISLSSGLPILVAGAFAYILYRSRKIISIVFSNAWKIVNNESIKTIAFDVIYLSGKIISKTGNFVYDSLANNLNNDFERRNKIINLKKQIIRLNTNSLKDYNILVYELRKQVDSLDNNDLSVPYYTIEQLKGTDDYSILAKKFNDKLHEFIDNFFWGKNCLAYKMSIEDLDKVERFHLLPINYYYYKDDYSIKINIIKEYLEKRIFSETQSKGGCSGVFFIFFIFLLILII